VSQSIGKIPRFPVDLFASVRQLEAVGRSKRHRGLGADWRFVSGLQIG